MASEAVTSCAVTSEAISCVVVGVSLERSLMLRLSLLVLEIGSNIFFFSVGQLHILVVIFVFPFAKWREVFKVRDLSSLQ